MSKFAMHESGTLTRRASDGSEGWSVDLTTLAGAPG
jgi:hypothetical protein